MAFPSKMSLATAAMLIVSASSAFAIDTKRQHPSRDSRDASYRSDIRIRPLITRAQIKTSGEPFSAAEKRAFQEPTGREVDRW